MYYPFTEAAIFACLTLSNYFCAYSNIDPFRFCKSNAEKIHLQLGPSLEKHVLVAHYLHMVFGTERNARYRFIALSAVLAGILVYLDVPLIFICGSLVGFFGVKIEVPRRPWKSVGSLDYRYVIGEYLVRYLSENNIEEGEALGLFTAFLILTPNEYSLDEIKGLIDKFAEGLADEAVKTLDKGIERYLVARLADARWYTYLTWHNELYSLYEGLELEDEVYED